MARVTRGQLDKAIKLIKDEIQFYNQRARLYYYGYYSYSSYTRAGEARRSRPSYEAIGKHRESIFSRVEKLNKELSKLKARKASRLANQKKKYVGANLAELVAEGNCDSLAGVRFCSSTGREISFDLKMYKKKEDNGYYRNPYAYYTRDELDVTTPAEIGMARMRGYNFDAEYIKTYQAKERRRYSSDHKGVLYRAENNADNSELVAEANKFKSRVKDSVWVTYIDTPSKKVSPLQFKSICIYKGPKRVNKKEYRKSLKVGA